MTSLLLLALATAAPDDGWQPLFDGKTLNGWKNPYDWGDARVEDGEIRLKGNKKFFLCTEKPYADFIFEADIKMPEGKANSGFMFRCHVEKNRVTGYQAEVDPSDRKWSGGFYDEGRRRWLDPKRGDEASVKAFRARAGDCFKRTDWNTYRIHCEGDRIRISVNGVQTVDARDSVDARGYLALQHHGEKGQVYRFRNLRIKVLGPAPDLQPIFNGKDLAGWQVPADNPWWSVKDGVLVGQSDDKLRGHLLKTGKSYGDFILETEVRWNGVIDSGIYLRKPSLQVQIGLSGSLKVDMTCSVYVGGRGYPWRAKGVKELLKEGEWNRIRVKAQGSNYAVWLNGEKVLAFESPDFPGAAPIALQIHSRRKMKVEFRNMRAATLTD